MSSIISPSWGTGGGAERGLSYGREVPALKKSITAAVGNFLVVLSRSHQPGFSFDAFGKVIHGDDDKPSRVLWFHTAPPLRHPPILVVVTGLVQSQSAPPPDTGGAGGSQTGSLQSRNIIC